MTSIRSLGIDTRNDRGDILAGFAARTNLKVMKHSSNIKDIRDEHVKTRAVDRRIKSTLFLQVTEHGK